ncbi:MAG: hypothetical protein NWQ53_08200, partial [Flavobacteriales bacterium]|nr:hypothetical protein [Flavobacteriales bacterium]
AEGGVIGVLPGILGSIQANEVIKVISGVGETLSGRLFLFDAASFETRTLKVQKSPTNPLNGDNPSQTELIDYQQFCGIGVEEDAAVTENVVKGISVEAFLELKESGEDYQLIDVREPFEFEIAEMGGELIPLATIAQNADR